MNILNRIKHPDAPPDAPPPTKTGPNTLIKNAIKEADANDAGKVPPAPADTGEGNKEAKLPKPP